jgi:indolepyruvate ferredoxin oxidoreductase
MIIVVEEKRSLIEVQVREELYGTATQPIVVGKKDEKGDWLFPVRGALEPNDIAIAIGERLLKYSAGQALGAPATAEAGAGDAGARPSTRAARPISARAARTIPRPSCPEGSRAYAGIGCHYMAQWMDRDRRLHPDGRRGRQLGWAKQVSPSATMFSRISATAPTIIPGSLALRFAVASGVNITYKILFNDAVAMTGGQPHDGGLAVENRPAGSGGRRVAHRRRFRRTR